MGQAKKRGSFKQRQKHAVARDTAMRSLGGKENVAKYFRLVRENQAMALASDEGKKFSMEEAERYAQNEEFIERYKKEFEEKYNANISKD